MGKIKFKVFNILRAEESLSKIGIQLYDENDMCKTLNAILYEIALKWRTLKLHQQNIVSTIVVGTRDSANFIKYMNSFNINRRIMR